MVLQQKRITSLMIKKACYKERSIVMRLLSSISKPVKSIRQPVQQIIKKLKIQRIVKTAFNLKFLAIESFQKKSKSFQNKLQSCLQRPNESNDPILQCIGGDRFHTSHSEPFFRETAYRMWPEDITIILDDGGRMRNTMVEKINDISKGLKWSCNEICIVREETVQAVIGFIRVVSSTRSEELLQMLDSIDVCSKRN